jgi:short subunit dehydrogenase-like uncharacterized protein
MHHFLIYGANGYTGELVTREAVRQGLRPILAGRNRDAVSALATELKLEHRAFSLDDSTALDAALSGMSCVIHCAGPFAHTSRAMADGCLRNRVAYLDVTGEIAVFESLAARDAEAKAAGVMLLPGVGFDVVPSDCLAAHLKRRLPSATHLTLAFASAGRISRGTATTMAENLGSTGAVRCNGALTPVPVAAKTRTIDFGEGPVKAMLIPWGDVSTAYHSTGIPNIEVYVAAPLGRRIGAKLLPYVGWLIGSAPVQRWLKNRIRSGPPGPSAEERATGKTHLWGEAKNDTGQLVVSRMTGPEGYTFTALTAIAVAQRVLAGEAPAGFQTPSRAYGADFVLAVPGVTRGDA